MSLIKSVDGANPAPHGGNMEANTGGSDVGTIGYVQYPFPSEMPARSNPEIKGTVDFKFTMVNQGTSATSYGEQSEEASSETGGGDNQQETSGSPHES